MTKRPFGTLLAVAGAVVALDFWTKRWATRTLADAPPVAVVGDLVRLTYARNSGVAFGIGAGVPFPYYLFSIAAALAIFYLFLRGRVQDRRGRLALALILGGAVGNLVDRIATGQVVDFIEIGWHRWRWPVFNVADTAVTIGVVLFAITWPRREPAVVAEDLGGASAVPPDHEPLHGPIHAPPAPLETREHDSGAGPLRSAPGHRGAAGPLPGRGADGPLA